MRPAKSVIGTLDAGAAFGPYNCISDPLTADFTNTATVTGTPPDGPDVRDSATAVVDVIGAFIVISKTPDTPQVVAGGTATFTIEVTNISNGGLTNIEVTDPLAPHCNRTIGILAAGVSYPTYTCTRADVTADFTNLATVTGKRPGGQAVSDSDIAAVVVTTPPKPPIIVNHGAYVQWKYPDGKTYLSRSNSVIWNALQLWLPLVLRN